MEYLNEIPFTSGQTLSIKLKKFVNGNEDNSGDWDVHYQIFDIPYQINPSEPKKVDDWIIYLSSNETSNLLSNKLLRVKVSKGNVTDIMNIKLIFQG